MVTCCCNCAPEVARCMCWWLWCDYAEPALNYSFLSEICIQVIGSLGFSYVLWLWWICAPFGIINQCKIVRGFLQQWRTETALLQPAGSNQTLRISSGEVGFIFFRFHNYVKLKKKYTQWWGLQFQVLHKQITYNSPHKGQGHLKTKHPTDFRLTHLTAGLTGLTGEHVLLWGMWFHDI